MHFNLDTNIRTYVTFVCLILKFTKILLKFDNFFILKIHSFIQFLFIQVFSVFFSRGYLFLQVLDATNIQIFVIKILQVFIFIIVKENV